MLRPRPSTSSATQAAAVSLANSTGNAVIACTRWPMSMLSHALACSGAISSRFCQPPRPSGAAIPTPHRRGSNFGPSSTAMLLSADSIWPNTVSGTGNG
ncbi:hypothetical protein D3C81_953090 [compost metagenome]